MDKFILKVSRHDYHHVEMGRNIERLKFYLEKVLDSTEYDDEVELTVEPQMLYFFAQTPHITRKELAKGLRSIAYKIQHGDEEGKIIGD